MNTAVDCDKMLELFRPYLEGELRDAEAEALEAHMTTCRFCASEFEEEKKVVTLLGEAFSEKKISDDFTVKADRRMLELSRTPQEQSLPAGVGGIPHNDMDGLPFIPELSGAKSERRFAGLAAIFSGAPWWAVSVVLHVLVIALAGLISMAIALPQNDVPVMVTEIDTRPAIRVEAEKPLERRDILASKHETPPTDPTSPQMNTIVVPPEILVNASVADHFETINPDRPDTQSAFGNPEAQMFHSREGSADEAGGGGTEGVSLDDAIGVGGASSGRGGGWGGGEGTGSGVGTGSGRGSFGQRGGGGRRLLVQRHGGSKATEGAVDRGLEWLARNQEADGHWDACKHGAKAGPWTTCQETLDVSCTGLALLAFLGAGHTEKIGKYKENVAKGLKWLKARQNPDTGGYAQYNYAHAIATMAMAEAAGMARVRETIESAQKAIDLTTGAKKKWDTSERGGWKYHPTQMGGMAGCDMSNSGWAFMAIKSAKVAGLRVPTESIEGCMAYMTACQNDKGKGAYPEHKYSYGVEKIYKKDAEAYRGYIAILGRLFFGTPPNEVEEGVKFVIERFGGEKNGGLPHSGLVADGAWKDGANVNMYYTYYMTLICFQVGGEVWQKWNERLKTALPKTQIIGGANDGSWDPRGTYHEDWGRVGQTALSILSMEVYYRYQKLQP
ncbi:MAG TPA: hypothetical protein VEJ63_02355 [Planctomycetota bacterium]|nr:hypothetical protein [Planctomycetota bacterium]